MSTEQKIAVIPAHEWEELKEQNRQTHEKVSCLIDKDFGETYLESKEIPKLLKISPKTWQNWRDRKYFPFIQLGSKIWVKRSDLEKFLESHYVKA
jgi:hypothetical protein